MLLALQSLYLFERVMVRGFSGIGPLEFPSGVPCTMHGTVSFVKAQHETTMFNLSRSVLLVQVYVMEGFNPHLLGG